MNTPSLSSAELIIEEAKKRGIEVTSYAHLRPGYALLKKGDHQEYIFQSQSNLLGRVTARMFNDNKVLATHLFRTNGFSVPDDMLTNDINEGLAFLAKYKKMVVKPVGNDGGDGVTPGITTEQELREAFEFAAPHNNDETGRVVCQQHVEGKDYRVLVVNKKQCFAMERVPGRVVGDGQHTIDELMTTYNATARPGYEIKMHPSGHSLLAEHGYSVATVPPAGEIVRVVRVANAHAGGTVHDATDIVGEVVKQEAIRLATVFDCPLIGVDFLTPDITSDIGVIIEVNVSPDISIHAFPASGEKRMIAPLLLDLLFPETAA